MSFPLHFFHWKQVTKSNPYSKGRELDSIFCWEECEDYADIFQNHFSLPSGHKLYSSYIQNTPLLKAPKVLPSTASGSCLRFRILLSKSSPGADKAVWIWFLRYSSLSTIAFTLKTCELESHYLTLYPAHPVCSIGQA